MWGDAIADPAAQATRTSPVNHTKNHVEIVNITTNNPQVLSIGRCLCARYFMQQVFFAVFSCSFPITCDERQDEQGGVAAIEGGRKNVYVRCGR